MKTRFIMMMAVAATMLAACGNDDESDNWAGEIRLSSGIEVQTRATHNLDTNLKSGESVHIWVDDAKDTQTTVTAENLYKNNVLTAGDAGALSGGTAMYFPQSGNSVNIYALHTNATLSGDEFPSTQLTHTVATNQRSDNTTAGEGYQGSDLVFAKKEGVARTSETVNLSFKHLLSKIEVVLVQGNGTPSIDKVEILNTKLNALYTPSKTEDFSVTVAEDGGTQAIEIDKGTTAADIAEKTDTDEGKVFNEAIIVPQTLNKGTEFIRITTTAGGVLIHKLAVETTFEAGKRYRYTITANLTGLEVYSSITDWGAPVKTIGTAEM